MVNERSQPRQVCRAAEHLEHGTSRGRAPDGFDRVDDLGTTGAREYGDEHRRPFTQSERPSLSRSLGHISALPLENRRHGGPGSPKTSSQEPRQHPPDALAARTSEDDDVDPSRAAVMSGQDSWLAVVDVQRPATALAFVGSNGTGIGQRSLMRGEVSHIAGDECSALLTGRIGRIEASCGWKRWVFGGHWCWSFRNFQLPRRFLLVQVSSSRWSLGPPSSASFRHFLDSAISTRPTTAAESRVTPVATSRDERGTNAHHFTGSIRDVTPGLA